MNTHSARNDRGYVLLAVLLIATLLASVVMTYSRHALLAADASAANLSAQQALSAADTGMAWAKQSLRASKGSVTRLDLGDGRVVSVNVGSESNLKRSIAVSGESDASNQAVTATFEVYRVPGDALPALTDAAKAAVNSYGTKTTIIGSQSFSNTDLAGVYIMRAGSTLTLTDVVLSGVIVSSVALQGGTGGVTINLRGGVTIDPAGVLAGVAIAAPDATISGNGAERVQLLGAVIANSLSLTGSGSVMGEIATTSAGVLSSSLDRPGAGRAPRTWPSSLETNSSAVGRLAFTTTDVRTSERNAIRAFSFPTRHLQPGPGP